MVSINTLYVECIYCKISNDIDDRKKEKEIKTKIFLML